MRASFSDLGWHWQRYLGFRDALRADAALRDAYAALKRELATRYPRDREAYIEGKTAFVEAVVRARGDVRDASSTDGRAPTHRDARRDTAFASRAEISDPR